MQTVIDLLKLLKSYFVPLIVRWVLKVGGGILIYANWGEQDVALLVGGVFSIILGVVTSLINKKSDLEATPPKK